MIKPFACVLALVASIPAAAESREVRYDDLNLTTAAGKAHLDRRINAAARSVCGGYSAREIMFGAARQIAKCEKVAKADAYRQLRSERVAVSAR